MAEDSSRYYLIELPARLSALEFSDFMDRKLASYCKDQVNNVIIDISRFAGFKRVSLKVIAKWLRTFKSMGGNLIIVGITNDLEPIFRSSKISSDCWRYLSLKRFQSQNPGVIIESSDNSEKKKVLSENAESGQKERAIEEKAQTIKREASITESIDISKLEQMGLESDVSSKLDFLGSKEPVEELPKGEKSITGSIDINKLEQMSKEADVSDKLDFLSSKKPKKDISKKADLPAGADPEETEAPVSAEDVENAIDGLDIFADDKADATGPEPISEPDLDGQEEMVTRALPEVPEEPQIPVEPEQQTAKQEPASDISRAKEKQLEDAAVISKDKSKASETALPQTTGEDGISSYVADRRQLAGLNVDKVGALIEYTGKYLCLGCGSADYFLKGYHFHACTKDSCKKKKQEWYPLLILF
jgi:anti-anti-sigma regulatory factor